MHAGPTEHKLMHWDSSQCRQWCELQKRHRQRGGAAGQYAGSEAGTDEAEEAAERDKPDQASILEQQQQGEHSAAAAVQPALAEKPVKQVSILAQLCRCRLIDPFSVNTSPARYLPA